MTARPDRPSPALPAALRTAWQVGRRAAALLAAAALVSACAAVAQADEPWRVGRVVQTDGAVSLWRAVPGGAAQRVDAPAGQPEALRHWPLAAGDRLDTAADARAELDVGQVRLRLGPAARLQVLAIDDDVVALRLARGALAWRVEPGDEREVQVDTPLGRVALLAAGLYRADATAQGDTITVLRGRAEVLQGRARIALGPGQAATLQPGGGWHLGPAEPDEFARWALGLEQPDGRSADLPPAITGARDLDGRGEWVAATPWGSTWFPRDVAPGWAPYQQGRWVLHPGGGWLWVDDQPWGFAPYHYGQWVFWGGRWGWVPGARVAPRPARPPPGQPYRPPPPPEAERRVRIDPPPRALRDRPDAPWPGRPGTAPGLVAPAPQATDPVRPPAAPRWRDAPERAPAPRGADTPPAWRGPGDAPPPAWRRPGDQPPSGRAPAERPPQALPRPAPTPPSAWPGSRLSEPSGGLGLRPPGDPHRPAPPGPESRQPLRPAPLPAPAAPPPMRPPPALPPPVVQPPPAVQRPAPPARAPHERGDGPPQRRPNAQ